MSQPDLIDLLNEVLTVEYRSLARYVQQISPWAPGDDHRARRALDNIVHDQEELAGRLAKLIVARGGVPDDGDFPIEFAELHLLSWSFLVHELIRLQRYDIATLERCLEQLGADREARVLVEEVLGTARGHLETLEELTASHVG